MPDCEEDERTTYYAPKYWSGKKAIKPPATEEGQSTAPNHLHHQHSSILHSLLYLVLQDQTKKKIPALTRVFEGVLKFGEECEEFFPSPGSIRGLLPDSSQIGHLMGLGGNTLRNIQDHCCSTKIKVSAVTPTSSSSSSSDELVQ